MVEDCYPRAQGFTLPLEPEEVSGPARGENQGAQHQVTVLPEPEAARIRRRPERHYPVAISPSSLCCQQGDVPREAEHLGMSDTGQEGIRQPRLGPDVADQVLDAVRISRRGLYLI